MRPILVVNHLHGPETGLVDDALRGEGLSLVETNIFENPLLPGLEEISGIVSLGGMMGVPDAEEYPFLTAELGLLADALAAETPILGLCLGAQLLAKAAGGEVRRLDRLYVDWPELVVLPAGRGDPLFDRLPDRTVGARMARGRNRGAGRRGRARGNGRPRLRDLPGRAGRLGEPDPPGADAGDAVRLAERSGRARRAGGPRCGRRRLRAGRALAPPAAGRGHGRRDPRVRAAGAAAGRSSHEVS